MGNDVITYYTNDNGEPKGILDKVVKVLTDTHVIKVNDDGYFPIIKNDTGEIEGCFCSISGPKVLVRILSKITNRPMFGKNKYVVFTDAKTGEMLKCKKWEGA